MRKQWRVREHELAGVADRLRRFNLSNKVPPVGYVVDDVLQRPWPFGEPGTRDGNDSTDLRATSLAAAASGVARSSVAAPLSAIPTVPSAQTIDAADLSRRRCIKLACSSIFPTCEATRRPRPSRRPRKSRRSPSLNRRNCRNRRRRRRDLHVRCRDRLPAGRLVIPHVNTETRDTLSLTLRPLRFTYHSCMKPANIRAGTKG